MKIKLLALRLALIIFIGSGAAELFAADASLVERAKKEGTFMLYSSMNQPDVNHLFDGFRKKYPFITPKGYTTRSAALLERVITEARAGKQFADVIQGNAFTLYLLAKRGQTEAYSSPEAKTYADSFRDPANGWIAVYLQLNVIGYPVSLLHLGSNRFKLLLHFGDGNAELVFIRCDLKSIDKTVLVVLAAHWAFNG